MPNITTNRIKMEGIRRLPLFDDEGNFDFNKIIPMPSSLDIESGTITDQAIICYLTDRCSVEIDDLDYQKIGLIMKTIEYYLGNSMEAAKNIFQNCSKLSSAKKDELYKKGEIYINNYLSYGATTWYDWCCNNWGTKWNAGRTEVCSNDEIVFETAWCSPEPIIKRLSELYPEKRIEVTAYDEGLDDQENYSYLGGKKISDM